MSMKVKEREQLLQVLKTRFEKNMPRHAEIEWENVGTALEANGEALRSLQAMESTGGEPDVISHGKDRGRFTFYDCSSETPAGRRSICYDAEARASRKENKPENSAVEMCTAMGVSLLSEEQYRGLQMLGEFDLKTSSWVAAPPEVRALGGALFCDRRYGKVFVYHNGVQSYYAGRGFRASLRV